MTERVLGRVSDAIACDAFCSLDDGLFHVVVLSGNGSLTDVVYDGTGTSRGTHPVGVVEGALDVTAFWSDIDNVRNVITVTANGDVPHLSQKGAEPWSRTMRRAVSDALRVAGYDEHHHGIVATRAGEVTDQPFHGVTTAVQQVFKKDTAEALARRGKAQTPAPPANTTEEQPILIANVPDVVDIAALWADGDNRFVIVAEPSGAVTEFGYGIHQEQTRRELAKFPGLQRINACFVGDAATGRRVLALTKTGQVHQLDYGADLPRPGQPLATKPAADVACFRAPDGGLHVVVIANDQVVEVAP